MSLFSDFSRNPTLSLSFRKWYLSNQMHNGLVNGSRAYSPNGSLGGHTAGALEFCTFMIPLLRSHYRNYGEHKGLAVLNSELSKLMP